MKKVLIINSPLYENPEGNYSDVLPPIGLGYLCTALKNDGICTELLDALALHLPLNEIISFIDNSDFTHVGLNVFSTNKELVKKIVCGVKRDLVFLIGGHFTKTNFNEIVSWDTDNSVKIVIGEGDYIISDIVNNTLKEDPIFESRNKSVFRVDKKSYYFPKDISEIQLDRSFLTNEPTISAKDGKRECNIITSRGCIYNCAFCSAAVSLNTDIFSRERSFESIKTELDSIQKEFKDVASIRVLDDLFLKNVDSIKNAISLFSGRNLKWRAMAHIQTFKYVSDELLYQMYKSGCDELSIGIESGDNYILKSINKINDVETIINTIDRLFSAGLSVKGYFMIGLPGETKEMGNNTFKLANYLKELSIFYNVMFRISVFQFRPYHGTMLYNKLLDQGVDVHNIEESNLHLGNKRIGEYDFSAGNYSKMADSDIGYFLEKIRTLNLKENRFIPKVISNEQLDHYQNAIFFIGLSYKLDREGNILEAFSDKTASGKILHDIKDKSGKNIVMLNLVQGVPLDKNGKIRYPSDVEKGKGYEYIKGLIKKYNPERIFLFGKQVHDMFEEDRDKYDNRLYFFDHPSYISVYKKSKVDDYKQDIFDSLGN